MSFVLVYHRGESVLIYKLPMCTMCVAIFPFHHRVATSYLCMCILYFTTEAIMSLSSGYKLPTRTYCQCLLSFYTKEAKVSGLSSCFKLFMCTLLEIHSINWNLKTFPKLSGVAVISRCSGKWIHAPLPEGLFSGRNEVRTRESVGNWAYKTVDWLTILW